MKNISLTEVSNELNKIISEYKDVFGSLTSEMRVEIFDPKESIISFNRPIDSLRFLIKGKAKITIVHEDGNQTIVHFVKPEEYIGELTFLEIEKEHKNINAICECVFLAVSMEKAVDVLKNDPDFLYKLGQFVGSKMLYRTYVSTKNQNYEFKKRLAAYILMSEYEGVYHEKHIETAEYLGVSYRHLLYTIKKFIDEGYLIKDKKGYVVNEEELKILAMDIEII